MLSRACGRAVFTATNRRNVRNFTSGNSNNFRKGFDDRSFGLLALLVSVPAAALIWKHHKSTKTDSSISKEIISELKLKPETPTIISSIPVEKKKRKAEYLIIGGGAAGFSAIQAIKEADPEAKIVLVGKEPYGPYLRPPLSKELWFSDTNSLGSTPQEIHFKDWHGNSKPLSFESPEYYETTGVEMLLGREAVGLDLAGREVKLADGEVIGFERLLIATGAEPKSLDASIDGNVIDRVSTFRSFTDFTKLRDDLKKEKGQSVVIIGGGFLGSELAVAVSKLARDSGHSVTQVFPEDGHMGLVFPKYLRQWTSEKISNLGVKVKSDRSVRSIEPTSATEPTSRSVKVILDNGEELIADRVIVAVGAQPSVNQSFKSVLPVEKGDGGLVADQVLKVAPDVFAAGDVVSYADPVLGVRRHTEHFDHAVLSGKIAGLNMVKSRKGENDDDLQSYDNESMFWSDLGPEVGFEAVGLVDSSLTTVGVWARAKASESPGGTELDSTDIRVQPIGQTSISSTDPVDKINDEAKKDKAAPSSTSAASYDKGVVFYLKDRRVVGILMFNLFNRVNLAKEILKEGVEVEDVPKCVRLFNVEESA